MKIHEWCLVYVYSYLTLAVMAVVVFALYEAFDAYASSDLIVNFWIYGGAGAAIAGIGARLLKPHTRD